MPVASRRIVVLGGTGFLGQALHRRGALGDIETLGVGSELDLRDPRSERVLTNTLRSTDEVVMAAVRVPVTTEHDVEEHVGMAVTTARACRAAGVGHLTYVSSDAVYDVSDEDVDEPTDPRPTSMYGRMHFEREEVFADTVGDRLLIVRPTLLYGRGSPRPNYSIDRLCQQALAGSIVLFGAGEERRDHVHVDDLAAALSAAGSKRVVGLLNLASGTSVSYAELAAAIASALPRRPRITSAPRAGSIWHRRFAVAERLRLLPEVDVREPREGALLLVDQLRAERASRSKDLENE